MRFKRLRLRGIGPFHREVDLDIDGLPGPLVAITGDNGAGKTVLLECMPGALYRKTPTRGTLAKLARDRQSLVELHCNAETPYVITQTVDALSGKGEASVVNGSGEPVLESAKVSEFDPWSKANLPASDVLYAGQFASQGSGGFLDMSEGERKAVLIRMLGHEHLEQKAKVCGERARDCSARVSSLAERMVDAISGHLSVEQCGAGVDTAETILEIADKKLKAARQELEEAQTIAATAERDEARRSALRADIVDLGEQLRRVKEQIATAEKRLLNNRQLMERGPEIRAAVQELAGLKEKLAALAGPIAKNEAGGGAAHTEQRRSEATAHDLEHEIRAIEGSIAEMEHEASQAPNEQALIEIETVRFPEQCGHLFRVKEEQLDIAVERDRLEGARLASADERIDALRSALATVQIASKRITDARKVAAAALQKDDEAVIQAERMPDLLQELKTQRMFCIGRERELMAGHRQLQDNLRWRDRISSINRDLTKARELLTSTQQRHEKAKAKAKEAAELVKAHTAARQVLKEQKSELQYQIEALEAETVNAGRLDAAQARVEELEQQIADIGGKPDELRGQMSAKRGELAELPEHGDISGRRAAAEARVKDDERDRNSAQDGLTRAEDALERAITAHNRHAELEEQRAEAEQDLADWRKLQADLGRNGIQALEIDAAGPKLTGITNRLLHECHGSRFTITVETTRDDARGKKQIEGCSVMVSDDVAGRHDEAKWYSGGEKVILGEAMSLAIAVMGCLNAGLAAPTLVRDETGAALSPGNCIVYTKMLRLAADLVGADKILFVSHQDTMNEAADSRVVVSAGQLTIT
jgi:exonuclease SbcC